MFCIVFHFRKDDNCDNVFTKLPPTFLVWYVKLVYRLLCTNISVQNCWISLDARGHCIAILYLTGIKISCLNHLCIVQSRRERVSFLSYLSIICKRVCWAFPWNISYISFRLLFPNATTWAIPSTYNNSRCSNLSFMYKSNNNKAWLVYWKRLAKESH